jgi:hypothetical protein
VTPSALAGCIRELRRALGDDARAAQFIETAYRRGYRFVAAAVTVPPGATAPPVRARPVLLLTRDSELAELARRFAGAIAAVLAREARAQRLKLGPGHAGRHRPRPARTHARHTQGGRRHS